MANMELTDGRDQFGQALIDFSRHGAFPDDALSQARVVDSALPAALEALGSAKLDLEEEIRKTSRDRAPDVDAWIKHATNLQEDIERSRSMANEIVRQAEAGEDKLQTLKETRYHLEFLEKETIYNAQLSEALQVIKRANDFMDEAEQAANERNILQSLHKLDDASTVISAIPADKTTRAMVLLELRAQELRGSIHETFANVWRSLIDVNVEERTVIINQNLSEKAIDLKQAIVALKSFHELDESAEKFWRQLDNAIVKPRTDLENGILSSIQIGENSLRAQGEGADRTIKSLFRDLENIILFLTRALPPEFANSLSNVMMPQLSTRIKEAWLDSAIPASLHDMVEYQKTLAQVEDFAIQLDEMNWSGSRDFHDWVANTPKIWLNKRREECLDWARNQLSLGIGISRTVQRIERVMASKDEIEALAPNATDGNIVTQDWDAAWESDEDKQAGQSDRTPSGMPDGHFSIEETRMAPQVSNIPDIQNGKPENGEDEEDAADAWGWGDDDVTEAETIAPEINDLQVTNGEPALERHGRGFAPDKSEITVREDYTITSFPNSIHKIVTSILEDGAKLTTEESETIPVRPAAVGLFDLPILILAMYRAVSPYYYGLDECGNMYLYNDVMYISDQLREYVSQWEQRDDLMSRTHNMAKLEHEIKALGSFGKRAYATEMNTQRTIIKDLLGGAQNLLQQEGLTPEDTEQGVITVTDHIRNQSKLWKSLLPKSAWAQAVGSLINTVATKIIIDISELSDLSADEAYRTAQLIGRVVELDSLFLPDESDDSQFPTTARYVENWLKLQYLSQVLQSTLPEVKYLWFESDLSLYFTADEVVDLIQLSFENNSRTREAIREIKAKPFPKGED